MSMTAVCAEELGFEFSSGWSLEGISLSVEQGETVGLVGPNGAGKSTLLRLLATLLRPRRGRLSILGVDAANRRRAARAETSFVPQAGSLDPQMTVLENITFRGVLQGLSRHAIRSRADQLLEIFSLQEVATRRVSELSGGQYRLVVLARAFVAPAKLLLLDEPTTGLHPDTRITFHCFLRELAQTTGLTVLFSSHDAEELANLTQQIVALDGGRQIEYRRDDPVPGARRTGVRSVVAEFAAPPGDLSEILRAEGVTAIRRANARSLSIEVDDGLPLNSLLRALSSSGAVRTVQGPSLAPIYRASSHHRPSRNA